METWRPEKRERRVLLFMQIVTTSAIVVWLASSLAWIGKGVTKDGVGAGVATEQRHGRVELGSWSDGCSVGCCLC